MTNNAWAFKAGRAAAVPAIFALGAVSAFHLRSEAGQENRVPPVQPSAQVLNIQSAFEQVADKLRPSVVFIKSVSTVKPTSSFRQGADDGQDNPFEGVPGMPNMRGFRMMPQGPAKRQASGSGVIVRSNGYILTNDHVVDGADKVTVKLQDGREFTGKVYRDFRSDLAVVKINANNLPAAELANSENAKIGQWAIAFGSPFGLSDTMTVGVVSSLHRNQNIGAGSDGRYYSSLIQTDASINPGNSGGPLVDVYGRVVGINVAIESPSGGNVGIGFAIPANTARYVMDELISKGSVTRGYLGIGPRALTFDEQNRYGVKGGALVGQVDANAPGGKGGLQVEDVIVRFNGAPVGDDAALRDMVARTRPGTTVPVVVKRDGAERTLNVTVGAVPDTAVAKAVAPEVEGAAKGKLGIQVANANDPAVREQFKLNASAQGALIVNVLPGSPAADAGLQPGDLILRLNGQRIAGPDQVAASARAFKDGATIPVVIRRGEQTVLAQVTLE